ncbi:hypothetical protein GCM10009117_27140 [Gangjinia marincola]|uniref:Methyltransferase n=1 Tax=Gangjinia marincola TaxID=578463 RepID=A0ABP3XYA8_9FLAO
MYEGSYPSKRFKETLDFLTEILQPPAKILDLGVSNPFSDIMQKQGYTVTNTTGEDLDESREALTQSGYDAVTAFEIFEHILNPYEVLKSIKADKLFISVPLRLWFSAAYQSKTDPWDRHYHEFEDWQLDWILEKTGWNIKKRIKFTHPVKKFGVRPLLRLVTPRYYLIYAERNAS